MIIPEENTTSTNDFQTTRDFVMAEFLPDFDPSLKSEIYFALARIIAAHELQVEFARKEGGRQPILTQEHLQKARCEAQENVAYSLGYKACAMDFSVGNQEQLHWLFQSVADINQEHQDSK